MCKSCFDLVILIQEWFYSHCILCTLAFLLILITVFGLWKRHLLSHKCMSGKSYMLQIIGAVSKSKLSILSTFAMLFITLLLIPKIETRVSSHNFSSPDGVIYKTGVIAVSCILFGIATYVITNLNKLYSLRKQEMRITISQIILLAIFGICLISIVFALGIKKDDNSFIIISTFGAVLGWIFQDTIKSVAAFFYLRANGLLKIDDWIEVKSHGINGIVRSITLTTVQIENWDTTTSAFPVYILHAEHFKNNQRMLDGKTHGRQMAKTFIIDTGWIHTLSHKEAYYLRTNLDTDESFKQSAIIPGELNIHTFRRYLYHWLMQNPHVCQQPRLFVTWKEQMHEGLPLHIHIFINDTKWEAFEWQQSEITEHVIQSLEMFNLQLYQSPSGYVASNSNIHLTEVEANYRKV